MEKSVIHNLKKRISKQNTSKEGRKKRKDNDETHSLIYFHADSDLLPDIHNIFIYDLIDLSAEPPPSLHWHFL